MVHHPYHFQFPDNVLPLPSLVEKHQKANREADERVSRDFDQQSPRVLVQPEIRQTSKKENAETSKDAPQRSNPTRTCTVGKHPVILPPRPTQGHRTQLRSRWSNHLSIRFLAAL